MVGPFFSLYHSFFFSSHEFKSRFRVDLPKWNVPRWRRHLVIEITNCVLRCFVSLCCAYRVTKILALTEKKPKHLFVEKSLCQAIIIKQTTFPFSFTSLLRENSKDSFDFPVKTNDASDEFQGPFLVAPFSHWHLTAKGSCFGCKKTSLSIYWITIQS